MEKWRKKLHLLIKPSLRFMAVIKPCLIGIEKFGVEVLSTSETYVEAEELILLQDNDSKHHSALEELVKIKPETRKLVMTVTIT